MKKSIVAINLMLACAFAIYAQKTETRAAGDAGSQTSAAVSKGHKSVNLQSGTRVAGELQNAIDVRKAKVGDQVVLKTTQAIKSEGRTIVGKGARLIGQVTEVSQKTKGNSESHIGILFDRLEHGSLSLPISATISSLTAARTSASANSSDDLFGSSASASSSSRSNTSASSASSGGLLGGAVSSTTQTVGSIVGSTTAAVGSTVDSTTNAVGSTAAGVGRSLGGIRISESSNTSVEGGSLLSLQGGNLRLEKGTNFNLLLTQSAKAGTTRDQ
jgi:hypothetical protein